MLSRFPASYDEYAAELMDTIICALAGNAEACVLVKVIGMLYIIPLANVGPTTVPNAAVDLSVYYYTTPADQGFFSTSATSAGNFAKFLFTNSYGYSVGHKLAIPAIPFAIYVMSTGGNGTMIVVPAGYKMNVPRLAR